MRVLVTGGAGFIGSAVCRRLIGQGDAEVLNLDALTYASSLSSLDPIARDRRYAFRQVDIAEAPAVAEAFQSFRPDLVLHLAAESHVDRSISGAGVFVQTNVVGTYVLLDAALKHWRGLPSEAQERFRFLHVSTDEIYGSLGDEGYFTEETPYAPRSPYSASKAASNHLASAWFHTHRLPVLISSCSNNYGPYQFPEKLIPLTIISALKERRLPVYGAGANVRDWLYVDDHVDALLKIAERGRPGETYNVGGRSERANLDVVKGICAILDELRPRAGGGRHEDLIEFVADRPGHDFRYAVDSTKTETELGWRREEDFESGLRKTVRWYLDREDWWGPLQERYDGERLGL